MCALRQNNITPAEIAQWTNHRVMEWLRSVDLAEYAPNLRGSGVHGGLMVSGQASPAHHGDLSKAFLSFELDEEVLRY